MDLPVYLVRMSSPFVSAVNDIHHPAVIELRFDVYGVSTFVRDRSVKSLLKYTFGYVVPSSQTIQSYYSVVTASLLWILNDG